jgi:CPA2 family monovalent cation:H+ antiporter-2
MPESAHFLRDLAVVLAIAALMTLLARQLRLPVVVGYIVAGIIIGPGTPITLVDDQERIQILAELGVSLLLFSIGLEFSLRKLMRQGPRVTMATLIQVGTLLTLGYLAAELLGWPLRDRLFAAGSVAIASTMILTASFADAPPDRRLRDLVLGFSIIEDLVAMLLIATLTAVSLGQQVSPELLTGTLLRLGGFLVVVVGVGLLVVPRLIRAVMALQRPDLTLVTAVALCFGLATLAHLSGHSVALGAFVAGFLVNESGLGREIREMIKPLRDMFGALFFVAIGMLLLPLDAIANWPAVLLFTAVVIIGNMIGVTGGAFLAGYGTNTSVRAGIYMGHVGEFGFIIATLAMAAGAQALFPVIVTVSLLTAMSSAILARRSERIANWVDRRLPKPMQTYASLYSAWIDAIVHRSPAPRTRNPVRRMVGLLALDGVVLVVIIVATAVLREQASEAMQDRVALTPGVSRVLILVIGSALAVPMLAGVFATGRRLAKTLAERAMPPVARGMVDPALAPRRVLQASLLIGIVLATLIPVVLVTIPFVPFYGGPSVLAALLLVLLVSLWRAARDLAGHARAGAELVVHVLARQGMAQETGMYEKVEAMLPGLGSVKPVAILPGSQAAGSSLGELNLRGRTGATVVGIFREGLEIPHPAASERLVAGDLVALTGSRDAIQAARQQLEKRIPDLA